MTISFQEIIQRLDKFWADHGCIVHGCYDVEMGAGTFHPATFLRCLGPEPYNAAYTQPCRRPADGRYGENPNRMQLFHQYQVILKPSPDNLQDLYLKSLEAIGFDLTKHDIRFVHDDWESPSLGAWGLGWEVWIDGMEITQFTYFQSVGGQTLHPISGELTYGLERLAMYLQKVDSAYDLMYSDRITYGDVYKRNEFEFSTYNFEQADTKMWFNHFEDYEKEAKRLMALGLPLPAYDMVIKASHSFNLLDARGVISVSERTGYIARIRKLACEIAANYVASREKLGHPMLKRWEDLKRVTPLVPALDGKFSPDKSDDFLLEIGTEELPATFVQIGMNSLEKEVKALLNEAGISYGEVQLYGTPRRLAILVKNLAEGKGTSQEERRGPPVQAAFNSNGSATPAGEGFFRSIGMAQMPLLSQIQQGQIPGIRFESQKGKDYLYGTATIPGFSTAKMLAEKLPSAILRMEFPKKMRWSDLSIEFARPICWIVALDGHMVLPFAVGNILSGRTSQGHRQLAGGPIEISHPNEYLTKLKSKKVIASVEERRNSILEQLAKLEIESGGIALGKEQVLKEVEQLVEWPMLTLGTFSPDYLKAPKEILVCEMVEHQRYFPLANPDSSLMNRFVITANQTPSDEIRHGNKKVLSARLFDGNFLYNQDLKSSFEHWNEKLKTVTFLKDLKHPTVYDKVERLKKIVPILVHKLSSSSLSSEKTDKKSGQNGIDWTEALDQALYAADLCKGDLASGAVYEFPELQGTMGRYYAIHHGVDQETAMAIDEHWMPRGENDPLPKTSAGIILSLAEKIDNLLSCFGVGLKPSSSSDPYALRRQALGLIKIALENHLYFDLAKILLLAAEKGGYGFNDPKTIAKEVLGFFENRIKTVFTNYGVEKDEIEASLASGFHDIYDTYKKVEALHQFRETEQFGLLLEVFKRARGQLAKGETELKESDNHNVQTELLTETAEQILWQQFGQLTPKFDAALTKHDYQQAYQLIASLQPSLGKLFDEVKILDENIKLRYNRLILLNKVFNLFELLIDFSLIQQVKKIEKA